MLAAYTPSKNSGPNIDSGIIIPVTNAIESLNRIIRKSIKTRGSFPTDDAATKLIYLAIRNFEKMAATSANGLRPATSSP